MKPITVTVSDASAGIKYSSLVRMDDWAPSFISVQCTVTGTVNYTIETSLDDPNSPTNPVAEASMTWVPTSDTAFPATATKQTNFMFAPTFIRVKLNSGNGSVTTTILQSSNGPI